jgi:hypothetical protein
MATGGWKFSAFKGSWRVLVFDFTWLSKLRRATHWKQPLGRLFVYSINLFKYSCLH